MLFDLCKLLNGALCAAILMKLSFITQSYQCDSRSEILIFNNLVHAFIISNSFNSVELPNILPHQAHQLHLFISLLFLK
jgi:hypothetical protein